MENIRSSADQIVFRCCHAGGTTSVAHDMVDRLVAHLGADDCQTVQLLSPTFSHSSEAPSIMHRPFLAILLAFSVVACTSISIPSSQLPERVAKAANIPADSLLATDFVRFAESTKRERYAQFLPGAYAQTQTTVYLLSYNSEAQSFSVKAVLPLSQLQSTSVATRGAFSHLQQLQFESPTGYIAINFSNSSDAEAGSKERTGAAVAQLERAGTKVGTTDFWFLPRNLQGFGFPIPAAK